MESKKKTVADIASIGGGKTKNTFALSIAEPARFVNVKRCTKAYQMNTYQREVVCGVWRYAKTREQLVTELKNLKFCTFEAAVEYLRLKDYISDEDMENVLKGE